MVQKKGDDWRKIEKECKDVKDHPLLGKTYEVDIDFQDKVEEQQRIRDQILQSIRDNQAKGRKSDQGNGKGKGTGKGNQKTQATPPTTATKKIQSDAVKILAKVSPIIFSLKSLQKSKKIGEVLGQHITKLDLLTKLQGFEVQAQKCVSQQLLLEVDLATVAAESTSATNHNNMLQAMLASLA